MQNSSLNEMVQCWKPCMHTDFNPSHKSLMGYSVYTNNENIRIKYTHDARFRDIQSLAMAVNTFRSKFIIPDPSVIHWFPGHMSKGKDSPAIFYS